MQYTTKKLDNISDKCDTKFPRARNLKASEDEVQTPPEQRSCWMVAFAALAIGYVTAIASKGAEANGLKRESGPELWSVWKHPLLFACIQRTRGYIWWYIDTHRYEV
jgi:hypothetical protein